MDSSDRIYSLVDHSLKDGKIKMRDYLKTWIGIQVRSHLPEIGDDIYGIETGEKWGTVTGEEESCYRLDSGRIVKFSAYMSVWRNIPKNYIQKNLPEIGKEITDIEEDLALGTIVSETPDQWMTDKHIYVSKDDFFIHWIVRPDEEDDTETSSSHEAEGDEVPEAGGTDLIAPEAEEAVGSASDEDLDLTEGQKLLTEKLYINARVIDGCSCFDDYDLYLPPPNWKDEAVLIPENREFLKIPAGTTVKAFLKTRTFPGITDGYEGQSKADALLRMICKFLRETDFNFDEDPKLVFSEYDHYEREPYEVHDITCHIMYIP